MYKNVYKQNKLVFLTYCDENSESWILCIWSWLVVSGWFVRYCMCMQEIWGLLITTIELELSKVQDYRSIAKLKGEGKSSIFQFLPSLI